MLELAGSYYLCACFSSAGGISHEKNFVGTWHSDWLSQPRILASAAVFLALEEPARFDPGGVFCRAFRIVSGPVHQPRRWIYVSGYAFSGGRNDQEHVDRFFRLVRSMRFLCDVVWPAERQYHENPLYYPFLPPERTAAESS